MLTVRQDIKDGEWRLWYAWHPVTTVDRKHRVFLQTVERRWDQNMNLRVIDPEDRGEYAGGWQYRLVTANAELCGPARSG